MTQQTSKSLPRLLTLHAVTFLHPGTGQTTGVVDLPVQREVHTHHPMYAASGLKGALRDKAESSSNGDETERSEIATVFGGDQEANPSAGSISLTDARILAFPVRSLQRVFVWITCPMVIQRMLRDLKLIGGRTEDLPALRDSHVTDGFAFVADNTWQDPLVLEEIALTIRSDVVVHQFAETMSALLDEKSGFRKERLVVLSNADFQHFVKNATQISARIKLNENKTTTGDGGNLWYEETLPPETIFYSLVLFHQPRQPSVRINSVEAVADKLAGWIADGFLQIGGNESVGQGWCWVKLNDFSQGEKQP